jgi:putative hydrolase of the HAD superfamily
MKINKPVDAVLFDLYGTLLVFNDFDEADKDWTNAFYNLTGKPNGISYNEIKNICSEILDCAIEKDLTNGLTTYETKIKNIFEQKRIYFEVQHLKNIADETVGVWQNNIQFAVDAIQVLRELKKNFKIALITNFDHSRHVKKVLSENGAKDLFECTIISDEAGFLKPDPKIFEIALNKIGVNPQNAVYVGDNINDDIRGAFAAGIQPVLISRNSKSNRGKNIEEKHLRDLPAFAQINSLTELISLLS